MKIVQISTYDTAGGAPRATYRLHKGLRQIGLDCKMLVRHKISKDETIICVNPKNEDFDKELVLSTAIQEQYIDSNRTDISNTPFSISYTGYDLSKLSVVQNADIINLHWIAHYQSPMTLHNLFKAGKPIVWTLHDQWAFTGGCHYSAGCKKYCFDCSACPQLSDDPFNVASAFLKDKIDLLKGANLTIVTPSYWLATCVKESRIFKNLRVEVIPNSLETDIFSPIVKAEAKKRLDIAEDTITLLFGAQDGSEKRKGFNELVSALQHCKSDARFQELLINNKIKVLCFGYPSQDLEAIGLPVVSLGYLDSDEKIREVYSAADIFILPSLEDNLPNTILESLSCSTPVIAFSVGGVPDIVESGITGELVPSYDVRKLGEAILSLIFNPFLRETMGQNGREKIVREYSLDNQANHYLSLYQDLQMNKNKANVPIKLNHSERDHENILCETVFGPHFQNIYDQVLLKALKEFYTSFVHKMAGM